MIAICMLCFFSTGCNATREQKFRRLAYIASFNPREVVTVEPTRKEGYFTKTSSYFSKKPEATERTQLLLRRYSLVEYYRQDPNRVIDWLGELAAKTPTMEEVHALAELAEIEANWLRARGKSEAASNYYVTALVHSYQFLFASQLDLNRNAYDPQFRSICDIYNRSLEALLRKFCEEGKLIPNQTITVGSGPKAFDFSVEVVGRWHDQEFERFELTNDYETKGLVNRHRSFGLGVPLIAVRKQKVGEQLVEQFYPPHLTMALTAFARLQFVQHSSDTGQMKAVLSLFDPLEQTVIYNGDHSVPLESNVTTPLAYNFRDPVLYSGVLETMSLINAELTPEFYGMYMLEPYDPEKIPVVMVHGIWSSPMTWVKMFNDLRASPEIHANYQFWFYSYPTGQPFWLSARQMREDLKRVKKVLDPMASSASLNQIVLVGHSMGGLISTMQTIESEERFWSLVSSQKIADLEGDPDELQRLRDTFFFSPDSAIRNVITIGTPFQGSNFANDATQWFSRKLFTLPDAERSRMKRIVDQNTEKFDNPEMLLTATSLDSLEADAPIFKVIAESQSPSGVQHFNVYGRTERKSWIKTSSNPRYDGDGVVSLESANNPRAISQLAINEEHSELHQSTPCIYEVRRILLANLVNLKRIPDRGIPQLPEEVITASAEEAIKEPVTD
jgi:triacylglycerol esterase/lipase EstA (alpha/beta hydrolase family)